MKKILSLLLIVVLLVAGVLCWLLFAPATRFDEKGKYLVIYEQQTAEYETMQQLKASPLIRSTGLFQLLAGRLHVWQRMKPGRFEITKGQSLFAIVRMLRNNKQVPSKLVINKLRIPEDLAKLVGKNFRTDSTTAMQFLTNSDSLQKLGVDAHTLMTLIIPDTYIMNWNSSMYKILSRLKSEQEDFWTAERKQKAANQNLTPAQVYALASIVEEETNTNAEKGNIASVYMNRLNKGMALGADPTIKFALKNFALRRLHFGDLAVASPYNTYRNKGLPPGPICTPSKITINAVLDAPRTDYLFFVASSELNGTHHFSSTYAEHQQYAKTYQEELNKRGINK